MRKYLFVLSVLTLLLAGCDKSGSSSLFGDKNLSVVSTLKLSDQNSLTAATEGGGNVMAIGIANVQKTISVYISNNQNATVSDFDGQKVYFMAEGGAMLQNTCVISNGSCQVKWRSQDPYPRDGRVTILYYMFGSETFTDSNANGTLDDGEGFTDSPNPYLNRNKVFYKTNCVTQKNITLSGGTAQVDFVNSRAKYEDDATCVERNNARDKFRETNSWADSRIGLVLANVTQLKDEEFPVLPAGYAPITSAVGDGKFSGPCAHSTKCAPSSEKWISKDFEFVLSESSASIKAYEISGACPTGTLTSANFSISTPINNSTVAQGKCIRLDITDPKGNVLSAGTTIKMTGADFQGIVPEFTVPNSLFPTPFFVTAPNAAAKSLEIEVTPKVPDGGSVSVSPSKFKISTP